MRRRLLLRIAAVTTAAFLFPAAEPRPASSRGARRMTDPIPADPTGAPVVFYTPHQDDETLFMGQVIAHHASVGREVHVVLCSNGSPSQVLQELNGTIADNTWWGGTHYPAREGYQPLTAAEFGLARTEELIAACGQLGVPRERVHFGLADGSAPTSDLLPDAVSRAWADEVILSWTEHFEAAGTPAQGHFTTWWKDPHADHAALGQSLHAYRIADPVRWATGRWLVKPEQAVEAAAQAYAVPAAVATQVTFLSKHAGLCYGAWCPPQSYAIGYHSVGGNGYFAGVTRGDPNHIVRNL
jgi:LmbE family N-acetylglucosaminyl deacetylase